MKGDNSDTVNLKTGVEPRSRQISLHDNKLAEGGGTFITHPSQLDPVDVSRLQCTNFLFDRYSYIDIKTPDTLSPELTEVKAVISPTSGAGEKESINNGEGNKNH